MDEKAPAKKLDDQIIVRLTKEVKTEFMHKAKSRGRSASSLVMDFIMSYIAAEEEEPIDVVKIKSEVDDLREKFKAMETQLSGKYAKIQSYGNTAVGEVRSLSEENQELRQWRDSVLKMMPTPKKDPSSRS